VHLYDVDDDSVSSSVTALQQDPIRPEAALESILHANPQLIADEPLLIIGRQVRLDSGVADLLACDRHGNVVVVEVKIGRSGTGSASEETILSQPQTYAGSLSNFEFDDLSELFQEYASRLNGGEWEVERSYAAGGNLLQAMETVFGSAPEEHQFNTEQRLVVVAEEITQRTAANARYLLEQGLHFQATEVKRFTLPEEDATDRNLLTSSVIVDYSSRRVRPKRRLSPTHPELASEILERAFPELQSLVEADSVTELLPNGLDTREHRLISNNPAHPEDVVYRLDVKPDSNTVLIGIDVKGDDDRVHEQIAEQETRFSESGFTVSGNKTYRVVVADWNLDNPEDIHDVIDEVADQYALLVQLGHDVLINQGDR
jgi:hypothetical protein